MGKGQRETNPAWSFQSTTVFGSPNPLRVAEGERPQTQLMNHGGVEGIVGRAKCSWKLVQGLFWPQIR